MSEFKQGFTSFSNVSIRNPNIKDHLFRFWIVLESHMGVKGRAKVKLSTIAKEMGKDRKSSERALKWFLKNSNLKTRKVGYIYEFYTDPVVSVVYGKTPVSHIIPHGCSTIKRSIEKEVYKNNINNLFNNKKDLKEDRKPRILSEQELKLVQDVVDWFSLPVFKSNYSTKQQFLTVKGLLYKHGFEKLRKTYNDVAITGPDPHPNVFWKRLQNIDISAKKGEKGV